MNCASCGSANPEAARFCNACGSALAPRCPGCGADNPPGARFCNACGAALTARPLDQAEARKVITIVFADLIGSTSLHERLDAESARRLMDDYYRVLRAAVQAHGGTVVKLLGDGVVAAFGVPRVAEDDAIRAVRAAVAMQHAFGALAAEQRHAVGHLGLRAGVNTGEVVVSTDNTDVVGDPVNVAARLQQEAPDGEVLIGESTRRLVSELVTLAPAGVLALKGRSETVAAYRVVSLDRPAGAVATPFVGRDDELRRLMTVYDAAVAESRARLAVVLGSPGLGKSRLIEEVGRRLGDGTTVLTAHCEVAGGATFAPLAKALRTFLRIDDGIGGTVVGEPADEPTAGRAQVSVPGKEAAALGAAIEGALPGGDSERARIASGVAALLAGSPGSPEETFFVVRRFLTALATTQPVVLAIDDLQWAEPLLLDLVEHLVQWGGGVPLLVLAAARPELRDARLSLAAPGGLVSDVVTLAGLDAGAATRLAANVIGAEALPAAVAGRVLATSEGNPLFLGELVRMLVNDGALKREGDRWTTAIDLAALDMPPTIHALLAARIERLRPEERTVLERAAVVGRQFSRTAVAHLLPPEISDLDARLEALRRSELIEPDTTWFLGEPALRFHHGLTRDAAYRRVLKGTRAELHGRCAEWIATRVGDTIEHDETIGWHLEQAHQHRRELGPIDAQGRAVGDRAAVYLGAAGRRALARDDLPVAADLLGRALNLLDAADPTRADLALDWCEALLAAGDIGRARGAIDELGRFIDEDTVDSGMAPSPMHLLSAGEDRVRLRAWHTCFTGQLAVLTDPQALRTTADAVSAAATALAATGDAGGAAKAHQVHAQALQRLGAVGACEAALDKALAAARQADDRRRANAVLAGAPQAALWGPSPVTRASGRCLDVVRVLRITQGDPAVEAVALRCQAVLEALRGRTEAARRMIASSRRMVEELGITPQLLEADVFAGLIDLLEGDAVAAERCLRGAYGGLRDHGLRIDAARAAALLGRALLAQGQAAEAETLSHESEALGGDDLKAAIAWRGVRAEALARRGEHAAAVNFARAAVDIAAATDALLDHADARLALAVALRAAGRRDEAGAEEARAIELWEAKGATLLAERAGGAAGRVAPPGSPSDDRGAPAHSVRRRVRANAATTNIDRMNAAVAARATGALPNLLADGMVVVDRTTGVDYDREGVLRSFRSLLNARDPIYRVELLGTLGGSLALFHRSVSATGSAGGEYPVAAHENDGVVPLDIGAHEIDGFVVLEVDAQGRQLRGEAFATDRLSDAISRLYARYAELLPEGAERVRAAATARSVARTLGPFDVEAISAAFAPTAEFVDHRPFGFTPRHGRAAIADGLRTLLEVAADIRGRGDDVLALRSDTVLVRWTNIGTQRAGGGAYENHFLMLFVFGPDGLVTRNELFDPSRDAEALARFDELTAEPSTARNAKWDRTAKDERERELPVRRRVRPNAATAAADRMKTIVATRDADALASAFADLEEVVDHPTGTVLDGPGMLTAWRSLLRAQDPVLRHEALATLGDSLALWRSSMSFSGLAANDVAPFGAVRRDEIVLIEVDARGQQRRGELFAPSHLGDAIARLYQRYADLLPDGSERARATAPARSAAALLGPWGVDRYATAFAPTVEFVDHRILGLGSVRRAEALVRGLRSLSEVSDDIVVLDDDVLSVQADAFVVHRTTSGTDRVGGGAFERQFWALFVFGADGLLAHNEWFDSDRGARAPRRACAEDRRTPDGRTAAGDRAYH